MTVENFVDKLIDSGNHTVLLKCRVKICFY